MSFSKCFFCLILVFLLFRRGQLCFFLWYGKLQWRFICWTFVCKWFGICVAQVQYKYIRDLGSFWYEAWNFRQKNFLSHLLSWIFLANALWGDVCWIQFNFENGSKGDYISVREKKVTIVATNLMDGCTILFIQDARALWWKILCIILEDRKWKITFDVTTIWRWVPCMLFSSWGEFNKTWKMLEDLYF